MEGEPPLRGGSYRENPASGPPPVGAKAGSSSSVPYFPGLPVESAKSPVIVSERTIAKVSWVL